VELPEACEGYEYDMTKMKKTTMIAAAARQRPICLRARSSRVRPWCPSHQTLCGNGTTDGRGKNHTAEKYVGTVVADDPGGGAARRGSTVLYQDRWTSKGNAWFFPAPTICNRLEASCRHGAPAFARRQSPAQSAFSSTRPARAGKAATAGEVRPHLQAQDRIRHARPAAHAAKKPEFVEGAQATRNPTPHQRISRHSSKSTVALICINDPILKSH
jgi:hypothetical protein